MSWLRRIQPSLANEATLWSRAIFPLLYLAETERIVAQAEVPLTARIADVELSGTADGAFGTPLSGGLRAPFLIDEKLEATTIVQILKAIVAQHHTPSMPA